MSKPEISVLSQMISYSPETGKFVWLAQKREFYSSDRAWRAANACKRAGAPAMTCLSVQGYLRGSFFGKRYSAHQLAWALQTGAWPTQHIDHIDGDKTNNKFDNLRLVTVAENLQNAKTPVTNTSGHIGVTFHTGAKKWMAQIQVRGKAVYLGLFEDFEEACAARRKAERKYGFHKNHGRIVDRKGGWERFKQRAVARVAA